MKKITVFALYLIISQNYLTAQTPYYDAIELSKYLDIETGMFLTWQRTDTTGKTYEVKKSLLTADSIHNAKVYFYSKILQKYISGPDRYKIKLEPKDIVANFLEDPANPFLVELLSDLGSQNSNSYYGVDPEKISSELKKSNSFLDNIVTNIGGLNITTIADGAAQFLVERVNEELNVMFFDRFKEVIKEQEELQKLFPTTSDIALNFQPYQYGQVINVLRSAFKNDLENLIFNIEDLTELDKYSMLIEENNLEYIFFLLEGINAYENISNGVHVVDYLESLYFQENIIKADELNVTSSLKTMSLFSTSIRDSSKADSAIYVPFYQLKPELFQNPVVLNIYFGLIYEQAKLDPIKFEVNDNDTTTFHEFLASIKKAEPDLNNLKKAVQNYFMHISGSASNLNIRISSIKKVPDSTKYLANYELMEEIFDLLENALEISSLLEPLETEIQLHETKEIIESYINIARRSNKSYKAIHEKNYFDVFINGINIYTEIVNVQTTLDYELSRIEFPKNRDDLKAFYRKVTKDDSTKIKFTISKNGIKKRIIKHYSDSLAKKSDSLKFTNPETLIKYGTFLTNLVEAESSKDVKAAIKSAALPTGSSIIKKSTSVSIFLNSYLGGSGYWEDIQPVHDVNEGGKEFAFAIHAPIGPEISFGSEKLKKVGFASWSIFVPIIDLGALTAFRMDDGNSEFDVPSLTLDNIIVTGGFFVLGVNKAPISLGVGVQKGPQLRQIGTQQVASEGDPQMTETIPILSEVDWNIKFFISVDIPIFKLYAKPRR